MAELNFIIGFLAADIHKWPTRDLRNSRSLALSFALETTELNVVIGFLLTDIFKWHVVTSGTVYKKKHLKANRNLRL